MPNKREADSRDGALIAVPQKLKVARIDKSGLGLRCVARIAAYLDHFAVGIAFYQRRRADLLAGTAA